VLKLAYPYFCPNTIAMPTPLLELLAATKAALIAA